MKLWKLRNAQLCLPAPEIKEVIQEVTQEAEVNSRHPECVMEEDVAQPVVFEDQQIEVSLHQQSAGTSSREILDALRNTIEEIKVDNALVKKRLDKHDMMFQLILSRLPLSHNP